MSQSSVLRGENLHVRFDGVTALDDVEIEIRSGQILGLIGPNGAGKTTLLNVLSGFLPPTDGLVMLDGLEVPFDPIKLSRAGVVRTFQNVRTFGRLTALENVALGALGSGASQAEARETSRRMLDTVGIGKYADVPANALAHGEERLVGIVRALAMRPRFLLLDEPAAGLNEAESQALSDFLADLPHQYGIGLLVVEHDMSVIMGLSTRILVIDHGRPIALGTPSEIQRDPQVQEAYLGSKASHA